MDILEMRGADFLWLYVGLMVLAFVLGRLLRLVMRGTFHGMGNDPLPPLNPLEVARLAGSKALAVNAAIAGLFRRGAIKVAADGRSLVRGTHTIEQLSGLEHWVYDLVKSKSSVRVREVHRLALTGREEERLIEMGLMTSIGERFKSGMAAAAPMAAVLALGFMKISVGMSRSRPVGYLVVLCLVAAFLTCHLLFTAPRRTLRGDAVCETLRKENAALRATAISAPASLGVFDFTMAVALFGPVVLAGEGNRNLQKAIVGPSNSGSSSSCGSTGCGTGGGGGGSGGDGGGSGCGGCGGGGCGGGGD